MGLFVFNSESWISCGGLTGFEWDSFGILMGLFVLNSESWISFWGFYWDSYGIFLFLLDHLSSTLSLGSLVEFQLGFNGIHFGFLLYYYGILMGSFVFNSESWISFWGSIGIHTGF